MNTLARLGAAVGIREMVVERCGRLVLREKKIWRAPEAVPA